MKPIVSDICIGCGTCETICPNAFKLAEVDNKMIAVVQPTDYEAEKDKIEEAISACAVSAISWGE